MTVGVKFNSRGLPLSCATIKIRTVPEKSRAVLIVQKSQLRVKIFKIFSPPIVLQIRTSRILRG